MVTTVAVLGAGAMGGALMSGLLAAGWTKGDVATADKSEDRVAWAGEELGIEASVDPVGVVAGRDVVVVAVKPADVPTLLQEIAGTVTADQVVVSLAAGVPISTYETALADVPVVRAMPNTPALIRRGMTAIAPGRHAGPEHLERVRNVLEAVGLVADVDEADMDAVTAVSGSGPAYLFLLGEALEAAAEEAGLGPELAATLVRQTIRGAGELLARSDKSAAELRRDVTSPGGTTAAALAVLEEGGLRELLSQAVDAAARRSRELGA